MENWVKVEFYVAPPDGERFDFSGVDLLAMGERLAGAVVPDARLVYVDGVCLSAVRAGWSGVARAVRPNPDEPSDWVPASPLGFPLAR